MKKFGLVVATGLVAGATAQPIDGVRTIFLDSPTQNWGAPMNVAYHPGFDQYYTGGGGFGTNSGAVFDGAGNLVQDSDVVVDLRALNYNANTGELEAATYNAVNGGADYGLYSIGLDGSGHYDATSAELLASVPGLIDSQTMPAYNPDADVFYSGSNGNPNVNVADRSDGSFISSFSLDLNGRNNSTYAVGYDPDNGWIIIADTGLDQLHVFDTSGNHLGSSNLDMDIAGGYGFGYTNGQAFVWDQSRTGWQGYRIKADDGCAADLDGDGDADADDFFAYLDAFAGGDLGVCDIDGDGDCDADDFFGYLDLFAQGC